MAYELYGKEPVALYHQIGDELRCKKAKFHYTGPPEELDGCQWPMPTTRYAIYRATLTIHMILWFALSFYEFDNPNDLPYTTPTKWILQLGNWNIVTLLGYTVWSLTIQVNTIARDYYNKWQINKTILDYTDSKMLRMLKTEDNNKKSKGRKHGSKASKSRQTSSTGPMHKSTSPQPSMGSPSPTIQTKPGILKRPTKVFPHDPTQQQHTKGKEIPLSEKEPQNEVDRTDSKNTSCRIKKVVNKHVPQITLNKSLIESPSQILEYDTLSSSPSLSGSFMPIDFDPLPQQEEPEPQSTILPPTPINVATKHKVSWLLYDISFTVSVATTVIFWSMRYDGANFNFSHLFYGLNIVVVLLDSFMVPYPIYFLHIWHTYIFSLIFTMSTVVYVAATPDSNGSDTWVYTTDGRTMVERVSLIFLLLIPGCQIMSVVTYYVRARVFAHILSETLNPKDSWVSISKQFSCCRNKCDCL